MNSSEFHNAMNVLTDYCQWQECVTADGLNVLCMIQAEVTDATGLNLKRESQVVSVAPYLKFRLFLLRNVLRRPTVMCMYPDGTLAA